MKIREAKQTAVEHGRKVTLLCIFKEENAPIVEFGDSYAKCSHKRINLKDHIEALKALKEDAAFTIGLGLDSEMDIEVDLPDISRLHCYITHEGEQFYLYDCSLCGTAVILE